jgi:hypothetical protein
MTINASPAQFDRSFIPPDALRTELDSSGHVEVDAAREKLQKAIDFLDRPPFTDPTYFFGEENRPIDENRTKRYEKNGCKTYVSHYRNPETTQKKWWNEVLIAVRADLKQSDVEGKDFALFIDFHGGGFVSNSKNLTLSIKQD